MLLVSGVSGLTTRPLYDATDSLLRFAVRADATLTGLFGLVIAFLADPLVADRPDVLRELRHGAFFVIYGLVVFSLGAMPDVRGVGIGVIVANIFFTLSSIVATEALPLTITGAALTLASGAYAAAFAALQYLGVRRLETA